MKQLAIEKKAMLSEYAWIFMILLTFIVISLFVRGTEHPYFTDYESDITLTRFLKGDFFSLIITNRSPVLQYSIPYGGWPCLHIITQAIWSAMGLSMPYARLFTGISAMLLFAYLAIILLNKLSLKPDTPMVLMISLFSPIIMNHIGLGISQILIPCSSIAALLLVWHNLNVNKNPGLLNLISGFILGLTAWHIYAILPAIFITIAFSMIYRTSISNLPRRTLFKMLLFLAMGFALSFICLKIVQLWVVKDGAVITRQLVGITLNKFIYRINHTPQILLAATFSTIIRMIIAFFPLSLAIAILKITDSGGFSISRDPVLRLIITVSFLSPLIFVLVFPNQVAPEGLLPPTHAFEGLAFIAPLSILSGCLFLKRKYKHFIRLIIFTVVILLSLFTVYGYDILFHNKSYAESPEREYPLPPGNYDLPLEKIEFSIKDIPMAFVSEMIFYPIQQKNVFRSLKNFKIYGEQFNKNTTEDEIIIFFGAPLLYARPAMLNTDRVTLGVLSYSKLTELLKSLSRLTRPPKIALLVPYNSQVDFLTNIRNIDKDSINIEQIYGTPYQFVHFKLAAKND